MILRNFFKNRNASNFFKTQLFLLIKNDFFVNYETFIMFNLPKTLSFPINSYIMEIFKRNMHI